MRRQFESTFLLNKKMEAVLREYGEDVANRRVKVVCECLNEDEAREMFKKVALVGQFDTKECCDKIREITGANIDPLRQTKMAICYNGNNFLTEPEIMAALLR
jgi:hypothetical protein